MAGAQWLGPSPGMAIRVAQGPLAFSDDVGGPDRHLFVPREEVMDLFMAARPGKHPS